MTIKAVGGMTSADMVALLAVEASQDDKTAHDAMRKTEESVQAHEDQEELSAMEDKAITTLVGGLGSAAIQAGSVAMSAYGQNLDHPWSEQTQKNVGASFSAVSSAWNGTTQAMVGFADKNAAEHKIAADNAQRAADDCKDGSKQAHSLSDQAIEAARAIRQSEDQLLLLASKRA